MKRLLIFHPALAPYRVDFFNELGRRFKLKIVFLVRNNLNQGFKQDILLKEATYEYEYLDNSVRIFKRRINKGYWNIIHKFNPDIIFASEFGPSLIAVWSYKIVHNSSYKIFTLCDDSEDIFLKCKSVRKYSRNFFSSKIEGIICVNPKVSQDFISIGAKSAIYFPIIRDEKKYSKQLSSLSSITESYIKNWNLKEKINILFVGRLAKVKYLDGLLKIFSQLSCEQKAKCNLLFVGDGSEKNNLLQLAEGYGISKYLILAGRYENEDLLAWYNIGSFFILPSLYEPFGAVTGEALMAGMPALISNKAGSSCLISDNAGVIFDPLVPTEFESSLVSMINKSDVTPEKGFLRKNLISIPFSSFMDHLVDSIS